MFLPVVFSCRRHVMPFGPATFFCAQAFAFASINDASNVPLRNIDFRKRALHGSGARL
jgi:hypothetical protein